MPAQYNQEVICCSHPKIPFFRYATMSVPQIQDIKLKSYIILQFDNDLENIGLLVQNLPKNNFPCIYRMVFILKKYNKEEDRLKALQSLKFGAERR